MTTEITESLVSQVNAAHEKCQNAANTLAASALSSINAAREAGVYLIALDEQTPHGQWEKIFTINSQGRANLNPVLDLSYHTGRLYMKLARAIPEPIAELAPGIRHLKDMLIAVEALSAPSGHGHQTKHEPRPWFQDVVHWASGLQGKLTTHMKEAPVDDWSPAIREQVKAQIDPLVKIWEQL